MNKSNSKLNRKLKHHLDNMAEAFILYYLVEITKGMEAYLQNEAEAEAWYMPLFSYMKLLVFVVIAAIIFTAFKITKVINV